MFVFSNEQQPQLINNSKQHYLQTKIYVYNISPSLSVIVMLLVMMLRCVIEQNLETEWLDLIQLKINTWGNINHFAPIWLRASVFQTAGQSSVLLVKELF